MPWKCSGKIPHVFESDSKPKECPKCGNKTIKKVWHRPGRPKVKDGDESKLVEIYDLLPQDGSRLQAKELKQRALEKGISPNTLFNYLEILERNGQIIREVEKREGKGAAYIVFYRKLTTEEFFGSDDLKMTLDWANKMRKQIFPMLDKLSNAKELEPFKRRMLFIWLCVFISYLSLIGQKARAMESERRKEFIETAFRLHLLPMLLDFSNMESLSPETWSEALAMFRPIVENNASLSFQDVKGLFLPARVRPIIKTLKRPNERNIEKALEFIRKKINK